MANSLKCAAVWEAAPLLSSVQNGIAVAGPKWFEDKRCFIFSQTCLSWTYCKHSFSVLWWVLETQSRKSILDKNIIAVIYAKEKLKWNLSHPDNLKPRNLILVFQGVERDAQIYLLQH